MQNTVGDWKYVVLNNNIENAREVAKIIESLSNPKEIPKESFFGVKVLTLINIPNGANSIGNGAFTNCENLREINIPESLNSIGDFAFWGCKSLNKINIPANVNNIGQKAFADCRSLTQITIPSSVTSIGNDVFKWCNSLKIVNIPNSLIQSIGGNIREKLGLNEDVQILGYGKTSLFDKVSNVSMLEKPKSSKTNTLNLDEH